MSADSNTRSVLVFFDCSNKAIEKIGNNNEYSMVIFGVQPVAIRRTAEEIGWAVRGALDDEHYANFLQMILDGVVAKQGIDVAAEPPWNKDVRLVAFNSAKFDESDEQVKKLFKKLFPKASFFKADPYGNAIERVWGPGRPRSEKAKEDQNGDQRLQLFIEELELGVRPYNQLKRVGIETIGDLVSKSRNQLLAIPNMGLRSVEEIEEALTTWGLQLHPNWNS